MRRSCFHDIARLKDVVGSLPVTVFQSRLQGDATDKRWEVTYAAGDGVGPGIGTVSALGASWREDTAFCPEDRPRLRAAILQSARTCQPLDVVGRLRRGHEIRWIQARATPRQEGTSTVWNGVLFDVTDLHRQADALHEAKDAAESALRAKEGFLAMMSHEIRTPMHGILGLVELLQNTALAPEQQRMLALARESGQALAQILDDILDYAKIEAARLAIVPAPLDLRDLLDSVLSLLLPQAQEKGLQLRLYVSPEVPATVRADGIRMRQILCNLVGNAIKFTDRGSVTLRATIEGCTDATATVLMEVRDTGIGIAKADMRRLFKPFVQGEQNSTRRFGGTGLGLAISRNLAAMMGGSLALASEEGAGTTAALRVPCTVLCQQYELPLLKQREAALPAPTRWRILVAEDHCINQEVIRQQLTLLGHLPTVVDNGKAALDALSSGAFDLVLTDFHLPVMDGFALTHAIRSSQDRALRTLPVVGITAATVRQEHERGFDAGMNACVLKPVTLASLQEGLSNAMDPGGDASIPIGAGRQPAAATGVLHFDATRVKREDLLDVLHPGSGDAGLQACVEALVRDREALVDGLARGALTELKPWCHRMRGALSVFGQPHLDDIMDRFRRAVQAGTAEAAREASQPVLDLIACLIEALGTEPAVSGEGAAGRAPAPVHCRDCLRSPDACPGSHPRGGLASGDGA